MITKRKLQFFSSEIEPNECNIRKKIHLEEENKILIKFHKNINITNLDEKLEQINKALKSLEKEKDVERFKFLSRISKILTEQINELPSLGDYLFEKILYEISRKGQMIFRNAFCIMLKELLKKTNIVHEEWLKKLLNLIDYEENQIVKTTLFKLSFKLLKKFIKILNENTNISEKEPLKLKVLNGISNLADIMIKTLDVKKEFKSKFLHLCLNFQTYKNVISSNLSEKFLNFMKKDSKLLISITNQIGDKAFINELTIWLIKADCCDYKEIKETLRFLKELLKEENSIEQITIENIFSFLCQMAKSFNVEIRLNALDAMFSITFLPENLLLRTIQKESLDGYKKKKNEKIIRTNDIDISNMKNLKIYDNQLTGIIIHLLEDEIAEVRIKAIQLINFLGLKSKKFSNESREILFYMLNDESDLVRIESVRVLVTILTYISIKDSEKTIILFNLKEDIFPLRVELYKLLGQIYSENEDITFFLIEGLLYNLVKFKDDQLFVYDALKNFSLKNFVKISRKFKSLLNIDEGFLIKEPDWKDPVYLAKLIIICNVINLDNKLRNELPFYFEKHYNYLNDVFPQFIHQKQTLIQKERTENTDSSKFFLLLLNNFLKSKVQNEQSLKKIEKIVQITKNLKNTESFQDVFVHKISKYFHKILINRKELIEESQINYFSLLHTIKGIFKIQESFLNIGKSLSILLNLTKYYCLLLFSLNLFEEPFSEIIESKKIVNILGLILNVTIDFQDSIIDSEHSFNDFFEEISKLCKEILSFPLRLNNIHERKEFFNVYKEKIKALDLFSLLDEKSIEFPKDLIKQKIILLDPAHNLEDSTEIASRFIAKLDVVFDIYQFKESLDNFAICFCYPNDVKEFHGFSNDDIILNEVKDIRRVKKTILLSKIDWSVDTLVEISIVKFANFYYFDKKRKTTSLDNFQPFQQKVYLFERFLRVSNVNKIILKQKFSR